MLSFRVICRRVSHLAKVAATKQFRNYEKWHKTSVDFNKSQAVSDGELNMSTRPAGRSSNLSLPGTPGGDMDSAKRVLSWAVSFEKLLEDPCGVHHFTAFLKSEVSAENILFWQACEKFKKIPAASVDELKEEARSIYNVYLSEDAPYPVNIDDTAKTEETDLEAPTSDMFNKAQAQIFKLMKMDSYRRFVRSPLYQSCTLASVEGKLLPQPGHMASSDDVAAMSQSLGNKKNKQSESNNLTPAKTEKCHQKRGSFGVTIDANSYGFTSRKDAQMPTKSGSSVELGPLYWQLENGKSGPRSPEQDNGGMNRLGMESGYCCVYLPDGSASLAPTRDGQLIKDMLSSLCEKRGFPLKDVVIYLHGKDKPLSLDQDCCVLRDQQVTLELRVKFVLEIAFTGKTLGIVAKSSKTVQEAISAVLQKHNLKPQDASVNIVGSNDPVKMTSTVFKLTNKTLRLDKVKGKDNSRAGSTAAATQTTPGSEGGLDTRTPKKPQIRPNRNREMDGFLDMLTRAQCCRVDDQRGLLTKEHLEVPLFLQLPSDQRKEDINPEEASSNNGESKEVKDETSAVETPDSAQAKPKDLKETSV
ncbi:regulator of G-protein signaling 14 isoform X2 [Takifugu flavidus]|uniref:regulator of G-protein signaling 14 isoform X2 n=1 Tax=Takifugu flavidus TaxID=433684 RepID=UPI002544D1F9|nr:regulator of G-protein signaling 14 isoform X2 [Takifugu flavidus]